MRTLLKLLVLCLTLCSGITARAQSDDAAGGRVVLVLPFENRTGQTSLDWVGESFSETLSQRFESSGFFPIDRDDREYALDHLGLPTGFRPSRATSIRIAQALDAEFVVVGSFITANGQITAQAQVLRVNQLFMTPPLQETGALAQLLNVENTVAWKAARAMDPKFPVALGTFTAATSNVKLEAYENYIRGIASNNADDKMMRLQSAVKVSPTYTAALLALGKTQYRARLYDEAATTLNQIPKSDPDALEANFYLGLSAFNSAHYMQAEQAFSFVASRLPLPEVVNNQGVALARQKRDGTPLLQRASVADPQDPDYHFNLAVTLRRRGDVTNARTEIERALKIRPNDTEAIELRDVLAPNGKVPSGFEPQERIRRTYSEAGVRQAVFQMDQVRSMKMSMLPPAQRATEITLAGQDYLQKGMIPEAEREFQTAIEADRNNAAAHLGLAQVRERTGNADDARHEAQVSVELKQSVAAYLVLARIAFQANQLPDAAIQTARALKLEPANAAAMGMKQALAARGQSVQ